MFEKLKPKIKTSITIDQELHKKLQELKERKEIESLSPMINEILWKWIENFEKEEN